MSREDMGRQCSQMHAQKDRGCLKNLRNPLKAARSIGIFFMLTDAITHRTFLPLQGEMLTMSAGSRSN
jgi:hypothetical protein